MDISEVGGGMHPAATRLSRTIRSFGHIVPGAFAPVLAIWHYFRMAPHSPAIPPRGRLRLQESQSKGEQYQGAFASSTQRTPRPGNLTAGSPVSRRETRTNEAVKNQGPPRRTRTLPPLGPEGSLDGLFW